MQTPVKAPYEEPLIEVALIKRVSNSANGKKKPPVSNESVTRFLPAPEQLDKVHTPATNKRVKRFHDV